MGLKQWFKPDEKHDELLGKDTELYHPRRFDEMRERVFDPEYQAKLKQEEEEQLRREQWDKMPDLPIPHAMWEIFHTTEKQCTAKSVRGQLVCGCGCIRWRIGESNFRQRIRITCPECGASYVIYDAGRMGWDALMGGKDWIERREPWQTVGCTQCDGDTFYVKVRLTNPGRNVFLDALNSQDPKSKPGKLLRERLEPEDWVDAFDRLQLDLECRRTHHVQVGWMQYTRMGGPADPEEE